ncbi:MAG TPA: hypothetical protein VFE47_07265 [Tepidisphaeraceae bacterium]|jgi:hypothetical protein|nr:hypothetical protein [Tepidisphaeraceae bacterium]
MQCSNCQFFNMPGSDACGRCGTSLRLSDAAIAVLPPRASPLQKRVRRIRSVWRNDRPAQNAFQRGPFACGVRNAVESGSHLALFLAAVIPGLPHLARGQNIRAHLFFWSFLLAITTALAMMGTYHSGLVLGLAFSIHSAAIADVVHQRYPTLQFRLRMLQGALVSAALVILIYAPIGFVIGSIAAPNIVSTQILPFQQGDVILVNRLARPAVGQIVLYALPDEGDPARLPQLREGQRLIVYVGRAADRILAGPGSVVECRKGVLYVDGRISENLPLNPVKLPDAWQATLPADTFFILPSALPRRPEERHNIEDSTNWLHLACIPRGGIVGRIVAQTHPLKQFHFVR